MDKEFSLAFKFFHKWRLSVDIIKYDRWSELHQEELLEMMYACEAQMDSVYWCWNCKHSECSIH